ncbi:hypothetical protein D9M71_785840 [compost metagenome]
MLEAHHLQAQLTTDLIELILLIMQISAPAFYQFFLQFFRLSQTYAPAQIAFVQFDMHDPLLDFPQLGSTSDLHVKHDLQQLNSALFHLLLRRG